MGLKLESTSAGFAAPNPAGMTSADRANACGTAPRNHSARYPRSFPGNLKDLLAITSQKEMNRCTRKKTLSRAQSRKFLFMTTISQKQPQRIRHVNNSLAVLRRSPKAGSPCQLLADPASTWVERPA